MAVFLMSRTFPIKDRDFHVSSLTKLDEYDLADGEVKILIAWHSSAINYLDFGAFHDIDGPAAEVDGKPTAIAREFQLGIDSNGYPFMRHFAKTVSEYTLDRFDVQGVTLRDVTIRTKGDRITYSIPYTVDQGGAVRQFVRPPTPTSGELTQPVLKSDIQAAVEIHAKEGGLSE
jgi:hypothetical protein